MNTGNEALRIKLEQAHRILFMEGLSEDTTRGHVTVRADDGSLYIKPWGVGFEEVKVQDFLHVDNEGNLIEGKGRLHSELILHLEIYRKREDIVSIVHVHPFHTILLSSVFSGHLSIISQQGLHFGGGVPMYESAELINSREQAAKLAETMADKPVVLMRNHGVVTAGKTLEEAVIVALDFEKAAKEHLMASLYGKPVEMEADTVKRMNAKIYSTEQYDMLWNYYCRKLIRMKSLKEGVL